MEGMTGIGLVAYGDRELPVFESNQKAFLSVVPGFQCSMSHAWPLTPGKAIRCALALLQLARASSIWDCIRSKWIRFHFIFSCVLASRFQWFSTADQPDP
jgi:hypothetical protein